MYTQSQLDELANKLNTRPRKTPGFKTPAEVINGVCCSDSLNPPPKNGGVTISLRITC